MPTDHVLNFAKFAPATDKTEYDARVTRQLSGRFEQGVEWMTRAMVARIHHHKFALQSVCLAEPCARLGIEMHVAVVGPGRNDRDSLQRESFDSDAISHEPVQRDDPGGV